MTALKRYMEQFKGDAELPDTCAECGKVIDGSRRSILIFKNGDNFSFHVGCMPHITIVDLIPAEAIPVQDRPRWMG